MITAWTSRAGALYAAQRSACNPAVAAGTFLTAGAALLAAGTP